MEKGLNQPVAEARCFPSGPCTKLPTELFEDESDVRIEVNDPCVESGWDSLVRSHPGFSFFHGSAWAKVLKDTYGFTPYYFAAVRKDQLLGLLPTMEVRSWLSGIRGVSLPFTDECAPLTSNAVSMSRLCAV